MSVASSPPALYFRQLLVGRDIASTDEFGGAMRNYVYIIGDRTSGEAIVVDPAYDPQEIVDYVEADGLDLVGAIATHYHADHVGGLIQGFAIAGIVELLDLIDIPIHVQRDEAEWINAAVDLPRSALTTHESGDVLTVGTVPITLIHTPGHTPGSQCILVEDAIMTGDTLFLDGCGRTDLPGGDPDELYESLHRRLSAVTPQTQVFAGHAYSVPVSASMGEVRENNAVMWDMAKPEWIRHFAGL